MIGDRRSFDLWWEWAEKPREGMIDASTIR
jgi:hypothetical protein